MYFTAPCKAWKCFVNSLLVDLIARVVIGARMARFNEVLLFIHRLGASSFQHKVCFLFQTHKSLTFHVKTHETRDPNKLRSDVFIVNMRKKKHQPIALITTSARCARALPSRSHLKSLSLAAYNIFAPSLVTQNPLCCF